MVVFDYGPYTSVRRIMEGLIVTERKDIGSKNLKGIHGSTSDGARERKREKRDARFNFRV